MISTYGMFHAWRVDATDVSAALTYISESLNTVITVALPVVVVFGRVAFPVQLGGTCKVGRGDTYLQEDILV
jgi:predicted membrane-bound mannosyltransferase